MARKPSKSAMADKILEMEKALDQGKKAYGDAGVIFNELCEHLTAGDEVALPDGRVFRVIDPFLDKAGKPKKAWKPAGFSRFDWEIKAA